ncbi:MAG: hypothetical protein ABEK12_00830, partial [Candidatus Nanohaloarchaea archaeon]
MFGGDKGVEEAIREVRSEWQEAIAGERYAGAGGVQRAEESPLPDLSIWQIVLGLGGSILFLAGLLSIGAFSIPMLAFEIIVGIFMLRSRAQRGRNPLRLISGLALLSMPLFFLLNLIGMSLPMMGALLGLAAVVLHFLEEDLVAVEMQSLEQPLLRHTMYAFYKMVSVFFGIIWFAALSNVVLSLLAGRFLNLSFVAVVVTLIGTTVYLFAGGHARILDAIGGILGILGGVLHLYEKAVVGHEVHGTGGVETAVVGGGSLGLAGYAFLAAANATLAPGVLPFAGVAVPVAVV